MCIAIYNFGFPILRKNIVLIVQSHTLKSKYKEISCLWRPRVQQSTFKSLIYYWNKTQHWKLKWSWTDFKHLTDNSEETVIVCQGSPLGNYVVQVSD